MTYLWYSSKFSDGAATQLAFTSDTAWAVPAMDEALRALPNGARWRTGCSERGQVYRPGHSALLHRACGKPRRSSHFPSGAIPSASCLNSLQVVADGTVSIPASDLS